MRRGLKKAFTLVEILIVVVILGILAAIVIPQFTSASEDAQLSNVETQLSTIRNQIELYRVRNNGAFPPSFADGDWDDLVGDDYLRAVPLNPRTGESTLVAGDRAASEEAAEPGGNSWVWDADEGEIYAFGLDEDNANGAAWVED